MPLSPDYELVAVSRTPAASVGPTLSEIDALNFTSLNWADRINQFGTARFTVGLDTVATDIKTRLLTLDTTPMEAWVFRNGTKVWAGPMVTWTAARKVLTIVCNSLVYYTAYMIHETEETLTADYFDVARNLISDWQDSQYGDYGIDVSDTTTAGTNVSLALVQNEFPVVYDELVKLALQDGRMDFFVEHDTRVFQLDTKRGIDLTASVIMDSRMIHTDRQALSVAAGQFGSENKILGTASGQAPMTSTNENTTVRQGFGRSAVADGVDGLTTQAALDDYADGAFEQTSQSSLQVNPEMRAIADVDVSSFTVGDTVTYRYDAGVGEMVVARRVIAKNVTVDKEGNEMLTPEFE